MTDTTSSSATSLQEHVQNGLNLFRAGDCQRALQQFYSALELNPKNPGIHLIISQVLFHLQQAEQGVSHLCTSLELDKNLVPLDDVISIMRQLIAVSRYECAQKVCTAALRIDPKKVDLHVTMAEISVNLGRADQALRAYARALEVDPKLKEFNPHAFPSYSVSHKAGTLD